MKQDALKNIKAYAFDWVFKGLIGLLCFQVKDIRDDVKQLIQTVPALQAKVDMMTDQRLLDKFRSYQAPPPMRQEEEITYDSLKRK